MILLVGVLVVAILILDSSLSPLRVCGIVGTKAIYQRRGTDLDAFAAINGEKIIVTGMSALSGDSIYLIRTPILKQIRHYKVVSFNRDKVIEDDYIGSLFGLLSRFF